MSSLSHPVRRLLSEPDPVSADPGKRRFANDARDFALAYVAGLVVFGVMLF